ncbi:MAG: DegT/DnrJ/EryC1/StrS family aminotransferase, partial [Asticcacaulis sp.]|nr:DegT/DnrJ/EryC1/StrS family aminotransferase [Asticcacaulis sp.]
LARRLRALRSHGIERDPSHMVGLRYDGEGDTGPWVYEQQCLGFNYRLPDINCALGLSQLKRLSAFAEKRSRLVAGYQKALAGANIPVTWTPPSPDSDPVFHLFAVTIDFAAIGLTRSQVMQGLRERGIGTQVHYIPVHRQPYWQTHALGGRDLPGADQFYQSTLSLPLFADMADDDPARVIQALQEVVTS